MLQAFELGYRRYEWKCDALNLPSRQAAERLGFRFEGLFRQAMVYKGRNRDTAWFSILDKEWPALRQAWSAGWRRTILMRRGGSYGRWRNAAAEIDLAGGLQAATLGRYNEYLIY